MAPTAKAENKFQRLLWLLMLPGRNGGADYAFGFQGQLEDDEIKGDGNSLNYTYRMHDPRIGRFFAVDPLDYKYPYYSPYSFSGNIVINARELEGLEPGEVLDAQGTVTLPITGFIAGALDIDQNTISQTLWLNGKGNVAWEAQKPGAITLGRVVLFSPTWATNKDVKKWTALVGHENTHRQRIEDSESTATWYVDYVKDWAGGTAYRDLIEEKIAYANEDLIHDFFKDPNNVQLFDGILYDNTITDVAKGYKMALLGLEKVRIPAMMQSIQTLTNDIAALQADIAKNPLKTEMFNGVEIVTDKRAMELNVMQGALNGAIGELKEAQNEASTLRSSGVTY
ncbi:MAG: hypothetical protein HYZ14_07520 [Bacteroidetes bacterium]|nr:hypothetical protein [Bacteroidota bacterium]